MLNKVSQFEFWLLGILTAGALFWESLFYAVIAAAIFFWIWRKIILWRRPPGNLSSQRTPADGSILALVILLAATTWMDNTWGSPLLSTSQLQVFRLAAGVAFFYATIHWCDSPSRLQWLYIGIVLVGLLLALFSAVSVNWAIGKISLIPPGMFRITTILQNFNLVVDDVINPNVMAGSLVLLIPLPVAALWINWKGTSRRAKVLSIVSCLAMLLMLILTQARSAWIAFTVSMLVLLALGWRWGWLVSLATGAGIIMLANWFPSTSLGFLVVGGFQGLIANRMEIWSRGIFLLKNFAFSGIGMGNFTEMTNLYYPFPGDPPALIPHAHNLFLQVGLDLGVAGLIAWLSTWFIVLVSSWKLRQAGLIQANKHWIGLGVGLLAVQSALLTQGITDVVIWGMVRSAPLLWGLWGMSIAGFLLVSTRSHPEEAPLTG